MEDLLTSKVNCIIRIAGGGELKGFGVQCVRDVRQKLFEARLVNDDVSTSINCIPPSLILSCFTCALLTSAGLETISLSLDIFLAFFDKIKCFRLSTKLFGESQYLY